MRSRGTRRRWRTIRTLPMRIANWPLHWLAQAVQRKRRLSVRRLWSSQDLDILYSSETLLRTFPRRNIHTKSSPDLRWAFFPGSYSLPSPSLFKLLACLELQPHGQLELTRFASRRLAGDVDRALVYIDGGCIPARGAGLDVVERVVGIQAELREQTLVEGKILLRSDVGRVEVGPEFGIAPSGAYLVQT